jgi:Protein of unknown function (DUF2892)
MEEKMKMLPKNIDTKGRILRAGLGIGVLLLAWWTKSWILLIVGLFSLFEAAMSWCAFYQMLGKNSCPKD